MTNKNVQFMKILFFPYIFIFPKSHVNPKTIFFNTDLIFYVRTSERSYHRPRIYQLGNFPIALTYSKWDSFNFLIAGRNLTEKVSLGFSKNVSIIFGLKFTLEY